MVGFSFYAVDESGNKDYLDLTGILDEPADELANKKYRVEVGQHDFDFDGRKLFQNFISRNKWIGQFTLALFVLIFGKGPAHQI